MIKVFLLITVIASQGNHHKVFQERTLEVASLKECVTLMNVYVTQRKLSEQVVSLTCQVEEGHD